MIMKKSGKEQKNYKFIKKLTLTKKFKTPNKKLDI